LPLAPAPVAAPVVEAPGWPCRSCGSRVALSADACPQCGTPFLEPDAAVSLQLPVLGDVSRLDKPQRIGLMIGGALAMTVVLVLVAFLLGSLL
jgi:uncharacterized membrane protein YvbJ